MSPIIFFSLLTMSTPIPSQSQAVLSEIMFDALGSDDDDEFIEIVNLSQTLTIDLNGWLVSDGVGIDSIIAVNAGTVLKPGQFAIILDATYFEESNTYDNLIPENSLILSINNATFGSRGLKNNAPETVSLINASGEVVSEYTYTTDNETGFSDEKIDLAGPNTAENWKNSQQLFGTPGAANSVTPLNYDLALFFEDIRFSPKRIQSGETVTIAATVRNLGILPARDFSAHFFEDKNRNAEAESEEEIHAPLDFSGLLAPGDSTVFTIDYGNVTPGDHTLIINIQFASDENLINNTAITAYSVGFSPRSVVINEIMYSPLTDQAEWFEIYNTGADTVELQGWRLSDSESRTQIILEKNLSLAGKSYHVFAQDSTFFNTFHLPSGMLTIFKNWRSLNNDFDSVVLFDLTGAEIDRVDYSMSWGGDRGVSLEKINPEFASNDNTNWSSSVSLLGGSPGKQNSIFTDILPSVASLEIQPNPFSPDGDGNDDFAVIRYDLPMTTASVNIKIYDLRGRLIRFLANNKSSGAHNSIPWNGKDDFEQTARIGIYIVFLQALNAEAGLIQTEKKTVVLAGKL
ncbi:MAG: lamin tail domain-containing protein [bacterium]